MRVSWHRRTARQSQDMRHRFAGALLGTAVLLSSFVVAPGAVAQADGSEQPASEGTGTAGLVINESYTSGGSTGAKYKNKFVELHNGSDHAIALDGIALQYRSSGSTGAASTTVPLSGDIAADGYYLIAGSSNGSAGEDLPTADVTAAKLNLKGTDGTLILTDGVTSIDGVSGDTSAVSGVIDTLGYGGTNTYEQQAAQGPTNNQDVRSLTRTNGVDSNDNSVDFTLSATITPENSKGETTAGTDPVEPTTPTDGGATSEPQDMSIEDIQGTSSATPVASTTTVRTKGVVTAAYPDGGFNGFYIQTPATGGAIDLSTHQASDAVFVYSSSAASQVKVGDYVQVTGTVTEYYGLTEINAATTVVLDEKVQSPQPATVAYPKTDTQRETLEGMLIAPQGDYTVTDVYDTNMYGEVGLAASDTPLLNPSVKGIKGTATDAAYQAEVDRAAQEGVQLDDGSSRNYLDTKNTANIPVPYLSQSSPARVGESVTFTKAVVLDWRNSAWRFQPTSPLTGDNAAEVQPVTFSNTRTESPSDVGGNIKLGTFNVLNYFSTTAEETGCASSNAYKDKDGNPITAKNCDVRGAWNTENKNRQLAKIVKAINALGADVVSLEEIENSAKFGKDRDAALVTLVEALNDAAGSGTWDYVRSPSKLPGNEDVIRTAFIYKSAKVQTVGDSEILLDSTAFDGKGRQPDAQVFKAKGAADSDAFLVVSNHFKSKGSTGATGDDVDQKNGAGAYNATRTAQAKDLIAFTNKVSNERGVEKVFLVGDFNSYEAEDPIQEILSAGYTNISNDMVSEQSGKYSYAYDGGVGSLDHVFANAAAAKMVTGADIWNINSVESVALEYSRYNYNVTNLYSDNVYRASDHDPVVVGLKTSSDAADTKTTVNLLGINDFHGRIDSNTVKFAGTIEGLQSEYPNNSLLISAGDNIGASLFASSVQNDEPTLQVLNALGLKASSVGNHEFDKGLDDLTNRVEKSADFDYLGANVYKKGTKTPALKEYSIQEVDGVKVGVIGAVTQETPTLVSPGGVSTIDFGDPVEAVNRVAAQLSDGDASNGEADVIVAEYHDGAGAGEPDGATLEQEIASSPVFSKIVKETSSKVSAIFTGHTHKEYAWEYNGRPIVQTGDYGTNVGQIVLEYDSATKSATAKLYRNVPRVTTDDAELVAQYPAVAKVKTITDEALAYAKQKGEEKVGSASTDITTAFVDGKRDDRASESTLGNLVADSLLSSLGDSDRGGAEIGIVNPGGLRDELYKGDITYAEANAVLPFLNNLWTTTLSGSQFKDVLEEQWQLDAKGNVPSRPYLQLGVSKNVSYTYDPDAAQGSHITSITINGKAIDMNAQYRIGSFSFLLQGGDNFRTLAKGKDTRDSGLVDRDAWISYISQHSPLSADYARRSVAVKGLPAGAVKAGSSFAAEFSKLSLTSGGATQEQGLVASINGVEVGRSAVADGNSRLSVTVPSGVSGALTLQVRGESTGLVMNYPLTVVASATDDGGETDDSNTGDPRQQGDGQSQNPDQGKQASTQDADAVASKRMLATTGADVSQAGLIVLALFTAWGACTLGVRALRQRGNRR
ncbi:ExeM/NucH family extracellular endonuclease [Bifidobacterium psychraerophilum]|uniref:ExeM/NucH family extracellular endonuclease n=1 Tax=Bifidobacterium psychraerophilum TaxID=218140 RepID=UPI0039EBC896